MLKTVICVALATQLFICRVPAQSSNVQIISVDLSKYDPQNSNAFKYRDVFTEGTVEIHVKKVPDSVGFFVIQIHTYLYPVVLSTLDNTDSSINGTNVGLVQITNESTVYKFAVTSDPSFKISALISVVVYDKQAPIPGGCNLTFKTKIAPYQIVKLLNEMIMVDAQAPSIPGSICERSHPTVEFYHFYLQGNDFSVENYFNGIEQMLTAETMRISGNKIPGNPSSPFRNYYSAYPGLGAVFGIIATYNNESSAYIPAVSYGCDIYNWDTECNGPITLHWKIMCAVLLFYGFFLCFFGHRFFRMALFTFGFTVGAFVTYVALGAGYSLSFEDDTLTAFGFGVIYGAFWVFLWWRFGVPLFSILLAFVVSGMLLSCIMFYSRVQDLEPYRSDVNYWLLTASVMLAYTGILYTRSSFGHIVACSLLGSFAVVAALSYYMGANLQYIVINMFRRATVQNFKLAMVDPPYQTKDLNLTITWVTFFLCGIYMQARLQKGKPPFPPHRALVENRESTPLLINVPPVVIVNYATYTE